MAITAYYNINPILSYNGTYNFVCGARGLGKTWGFKHKAIKDGVRTGEQFVYLRRYKDERDETKPTFFDDVYMKFPNHDFKVEGKLGYWTRKLTRNEGETDKEFEAREKARKWTILVWFVALSTAQHLKGKPFPRVTKIIYDEFILEKGLTRELPNETAAFNDFYSTIDRNTGRTKVFFLANSISIMNAYFIRFDIRPDTDTHDANSDFITKNKVTVPGENPKPFVVAHFPDSKKFSSEVFQTAFGQFLKQTDPEYADYAVANTFQDNNDQLILDKTPDAKYALTIECDNGTFSVWQAPQRKYYIQSKRPRGDEIILTLVAAKHDEGKILVGYNDKFLAILRTAWRNGGQVYFDKPATRNVFRKIFERQ